MNSSFEEMSANGSQMRFKMSLGLFGIHSSTKYMI
jgi:hypothetical protein